MWNGSQRMKRLLSVVIGVAAALSGTVALSPAASAYNGYDASATGVSYTSDSCYHSRVSVSGFSTSLDDDGHDIDVYAPGGAWAGGDYTYGSYADSFTVTLCNGIDITGRYSVRVDGVEVTSFRVFRPAFANRVVYPNSRSAQVRSRMTLNGRAMANRTVRLERYQYGYWSQISTRRTNWNGSAAVACPTRGKVCPGLYRFTFNDVAASTTFHLPKRRR